jgi:hypothetical protein
VLPPLQEMMQSLQKCMSFGQIRRIALPILLGVLGCGTNSGTPISGTGGGAGPQRDSAVGSGGNSGPGGTAGQGGASATGSGGANTGGRTSGAGGLSSGSGGTAGTGATSATGGAANSGGATGTGGARSTGGIAGTGGSDGTGGMSSAGGARTDGGVAGAGGAAPAGGASGKGGGDGVGGATAVGGTTGTGGSTILGATPPMGWNSWNNFGCSPSESLIKGVADAFVSSGMAAAGYEYVNIDDCWMSGRDSSGNLQADSSKFPSGIKALADYIHGKGLKLGIYETPSSTTCAGKTGGAGHIKQDANTFASWGVDYLKYDHCRTTDMTSFAQMHDALIATGRPIFYSINPVYGSGSCVPPNCTVDELKVCNLWRIGFDINASWGSFTGLIDTDRPLAQYAGPGHWNDPDMLEVGRGMSADEDRAHFGMWAMLAAPLITGNDITQINEPKNATTKAILTNADVIAVNQDPLGKQGTRVATPGTSLEVWSKQLSGTNVRAVALFNRSSSAASITAKWTDIGIPAGAATVRDLYAQKDLGSSTDSYTATSVPSHGIVMLKVTSVP